MCKDNFAACVRIFLPFLFSEASKYMRLFCIYRLYPYGHLSNARQNSALTLL
jgi:hypothetical protein